MHFYNYLKITTISLVCAVMFQPSAHAMWPTFDCSAIFQNAQSIMQKVDQYKTQILESKLVTDINNKIGDAQASLSKLNLDKAQETMRKADKLKKAKEKLDKIKEKVDKAKKEYEKKKQQFDDYKKKVEDAKKQVSDKIDEAKGAYEDAKSTYNDAKEAASGATALAGQAISDAKNKVSDAKNTIDSTISKAQNTVDDTISNAQNTIPTTGAVPNSNPGVSTGASGTPTTGRQAFIQAGPETIEAEPALPTETVQSGGLSKAVSSAASEGSSTGIKELNKALTKAVNEGDAETLEVISETDEADIINSDSKVYDDSPSLEGKPGRSQFVLPDEEIIEEDGEESPDLISDKVLNKGEIKEANPISAIGIKDKSVEKKIDKDATVIPNKLPAPELKKESFFFNNGDYVRQSSLKISAQETLKFADVTGCSDYNNSIQNGKDGQIIITSETLAKECCFKAENLTDMNVIRDCTNQLLKKMNDEDAMVAEENRGIYSVIVAEQNVDGLTEAWKDKADSSSYFSNVLTKYIDDSDVARKEGSTNDAIGSIATTNTESLYLLNRIRRIFTSSLVNTAIGSIGNVKAETLNEETEIGLGEVKEDYDYSVIRGLHDNVKESDSADASLEYPVIAENFAKKCQIKLDAENIYKVKDCYYQTVKEANDKDFTKAEVGKNFIDNIRYQDMLNILGKSLYQKVKTAKYDEELDVTKENIADSKDERTNLSTLFKTDVEMQKVIDEIIQIYAARIATSSMDNLGQLTPKVENSNNTEGQKNG